MPLKVVFTMSEMFLTGGYHKSRFEIFRNSGRRGEQGPSKKDTIGLIDYKGISQCRAVVVIWVKHGGLEELDGCVVRTPVTERCAPSDPRPRLEGGLLEVDGLPDSMQGRAMTKNACCFLQLPAAGVYVVYLQADKSGEDLIRADMRARFDANKLALEGAGSSMGDAAAGRQRRRRAAADVGSVAAEQRKRRRVHEGAGASGHSGQGSRIYIDISDGDDDDEAASGPEQGAAASDQDPWTAMDIDDGDGDEAAGAATAAADPWGQDTDEGDAITADFQVRQARAMAECVETFRLRERARVAAELDAFKLQQENAAAANVATFEQRQQAKAAVELAAFKQARRAEQIQRQQQAQEAARRLEEQQRAAEEAAARHREEQQRDAEEAAARRREEQQRDAEEAAARRREAGQDARRRREEQQRDAEEAAARRREAEDDARRRREEQQRDAEEAAARQQEQQQGGALCEEQQRGEAVLDGVPWRHAIAAAVERRVLGLNLDASTLPCIASRLSPVSIASERAIRAIVTWIKTTCPVNMVKMVVKPDSSRSRWCMFSPDQRAKIPSDCVELSACLVAIFQALQRTPDEPWVADDGGLSDDVSV